MTSPPPGDHTSKNDPRARPARRPPAGRGDRLPFARLPFARRARRTLVALLLGASASLTSCGDGGKFPSRPIQIICPWAPGGGSDRLARKVAALLEVELAVPVNVVNASGGAGVTGHSLGALARPDGYTLTLLTVEINLLHWRGMTTLTHEDFEPLVLIGRDPAALFVARDAPWQALEDLLRDARTGSGHLRASGTATLGIWHVALAGLLEAARIPPNRITWIPSAGSAPSFQALLAGSIEIVSASPGEARSLVESGKVRALAVLSTAPVAALPGTRTAREQGVDWELSAWRGLAVPRGTAPQIVETLAGALARVAASSELRAFLDEAGMDATWLPRQSLAEALGTLDRRLGSLVSSPALSASEEDRRGPYFFPALLGVAAAAVLGCILVVRPRPGPAPSDQAGEGPSPPALRSTAEVAGAVAAFVVLVEPLGFLLAAGGILCLLLLRFGNSPFRSLVIPGLLVPALYHVFAVLLRAPLPRGILGW